jgi:hypothetical protein
MSYLIHDYVNKQSTCFELYQFIFRTLYHYTSYMVLVKIDNIDKMYSTILFCNHRASLYSVITVHHFIL